MTVMNLVEVEIGKRIINDNWLFITDDEVCRIWYCVTIPSNGKGIT